MKVRDITHDERYGETRLNLVISDLENTYMQEFSTLSIVGRIVDALSPVLAKEIEAKLDREALLQEVVDRLSKDISARLSKSLKIEGVIGGEKSTDTKTSN